MTTIGRELVLDVSLILRLTEHACFPLLVGDLFQGRVHILAQVHQGEILLIGNLPQKFVIRNQLLVRLLLRIFPDHRGSENDHLNVRRLGLLQDLPNVLLIVFQRNALKGSLAESQREMPHVIHATTQDHPIGVLADDTGFKTG